MIPPKAVLFDLDDTLAESFQPPKLETIEKLKALLGYVPCAIITAAGFSRVEGQFLPEMQTSSEIDQLYIFPNSSAECYTWQNESWEKVYSFALTPEERKKIEVAAWDAAKEVGIIEPNPQYEPRVIDREAQVAFAAIGLDAPMDAKKAWDPDQSKRKALKKAIEARIPDYEVLIGGTTTIDITRKGINKSYGVQWLAAHLDLRPSDMLYIGDALYPGGNDFVVIPTGIQTHQVTGPVETTALMEEIMIKFNS